ncbi:MAG: hypothetical protein ABIB46_01075 [bacterium]
MFFLSFGFEIENFGNKSFVIRSVPDLLKNCNYKEIIEKMIENLIDKKTNEKNVEEILILISCYSSIRKGQKLTNEEMQKIIKDLLKTENPFTCPHGRPTMIKLLFTELEKKFKR